MNCTEVLLSMLVLSDVDTYHHVLRTQSGCNVGAFTGQHDVQGVDTGAERPDVILGTVSQWIAHDGLNAE